MPARDESLDFAAQLAILLCGVLLEGHRGAPRLPKARHASRFFDHVAAEVLSARNRGLVLDALQAVATVVGRHVTRGELRRVRDALPAEIRALWPANLILPEAVGRRGAHAR